MLSYEEMHTYQPFLETFETVYCFQNCLLKIKTKLTASSWNVGKFRVFFLDIITKESKPEEQIMGTRSEELTCNTPVDDIDFSKDIRKRTKRFYIGCFKKTITQEKLIRYVGHRGLTVTWVNIWVSNKSGRVSYD